MTLFEQTSTQPYGHIAKTTTTPRLPKAINLASDPKNSIDKYQ